MSNSSLTSSPARSSISTTAIVGSNAMSSSLAVDELHFTADLTTLQERKDEALRVLKSDLMATLNKEVRMLDEDSWMFEGPTSFSNSPHFATRWFSKQTFRNNGDQIGHPKTESKCLNQVENFGIQNACG